MIFNKQIDNYVEKHTTQEDAVLKSLNRETHLKTFYPNMLSGSVQGKFLEMISFMINPKRVLEVGTFTAYSAISMAKGLAKGGKIITLEANEEMESFALKYIKKAGFRDKIELIIGDAIEIIPKLPGKFDLVFIDADKEQYIDYYELALTKLETDGFILADNVLWSGKVLENDSKSDKETRGIKAFNEYVRNDSRVEQVMLTIRDGLMLIRKI